MKEDIALAIGPHLAFREFMDNSKIPMQKMQSHVNFKQNVFARVASFVSSYRSIPSDYKYYISESCFYYPAAAKKLGRIDGKLIDVCASSIYYYLYTKKIAGVNRKILLNLIKEVDGFICEGVYVRDLLHKLGIEKSTVIVYTYINDERFSKLSKIKPKLLSKNICITPTNDYFYKGLDILLEAMKFVNKDNKEITLTIAPNKELDLSPIKHLMGKNIRINYDVVDMLSKSSLYVHPSRGDVFPVACLEPMAAGVPVMVSDQTGTKEVVDSVNSNHVTSIEPKMVAQKILEYFNLSSKEKNKLSLEFRKVSRGFNRKDQLKIFKKEYKSLKSII
ncbi:MAG: glycosyltransferase [Candidatus Aenigmarchaeota archaeon]|nr:glycosyltransferase [Candidatus Aenigmarchaeota archaeon]